MLVRVDGHSCIVNRKTLAWLDFPAGVSGIERDESGAPTGRLSLEANWRAQSRFMKHLPQDVKREAERKAAQLALSRGYLHLHVQLLGFERDEYAGEIAALRDLPAAKWYPKICEPDARLAQELGLPYIGGDVFLDGSIGSCTAAVSEAFSGGSTGELKYSDEEVYAYFSTAEALGISAGVHAIGDRAIDQCIAAWERVLGGKPARAEIATSSSTSKSRGRNTSRRVRACRFIFRCSPSSICCGAAGVECTIRVWERRVCER